MITQNPATQTETPQSGDETHYRQLFEALADAVIVSDMYDRFLDCNPATEKMYGYARAEFLKMSAADLVHPDYHPVMQDNQQRLRAGEITLVNSIQCRKDGSPISVEVSARKITYQNQDAILSIVRDITTRQQSETALRASEEMYRTLVENANELILVAQDGMLKYVNHKTVELLGYTENELTTAPFIEFIHPDDRTMVGANYRARLQGQSLPEVYQFRAMTKEGGIKWLEIHAAVITWNERPATLNFLTDITAREEIRKTLNKQNEQIKLLYQASQELGRTLDMGKLYKTLYLSLAKSMDCEFMFISSYNPKDQLIRFVHAIAEQKSVEVSSFPPILLEPDGRGTQSRVIRTGKSLLLNDYQSYLEEGQTSYSVNDDGKIVVPSDVPNAEKTRSAILVPILFETQVVGVIQIQSYKLNAYSQDDLKIAEALAAQFAVASNNALLYQQAQKEIVERKHAEKEVRTSEEKFAAAFRSSPYAITLTRASDGCIVDVNDGFCNITGYQYAEVIGKTPLGLNLWVEEQDHSFVASELSEGHKVSNAEFRFRTKSGQILTGLFSVEIITISNEKLVLSSINDITKQKHAEEARHLSEARYRLLADNMQDTIWLADPNLKLLYISPSLVRQRGFTLEELNAIPIEKRMTPDSFQRAMNLFHEILSLENLNQPDSPSSHIIELEYFRKDGSTYWSETSITPVRDAQGQVTSILGNGRDVTARKRAEEELRQSQEKFSKVFQASPTLIAISELGNGNYIDVNEAFLKTLGYTREEVVGHSPVELGLFAIPEQATTAMQLMRTQGYLRDFEAFMLTKRGELRAGIVSAEYIQLQRRPLLLTALSDITERKRAEETLTQRLSELEALHRTSTLLRDAQTIDQALTILLDEALTTLGTDAGAIWRHEPESKTFRASLARGWFRQISAHPFRAGNIPGQVWSTGQPYQFSEFTAAPFAKTESHHIIPSGWGGACVPIRAAEEIVGLFYVAMQKPREIVPAQIQMLGSLAEMTGWTIHRIRLHQETAQRLEYMQALRTIDQAITASFDQRIILDVLLDQVRTQLKADAAAILLFQPQQRTLKYLTGKGFRTRAIETTHLRIGEGFAGRVVKERRLVRASNAEATTSPPSFVRFWTDEGIESYFGMPLIAKGQVQGVLEVYGRTVLQTNDEWVEFLETLANQAAMALDSTQLFDNLQRANFELVIAYDSTIEGWSRAMDLRDKETEGHTQRVTELTLSIARAMGIDEKELVHLRRGALLHDIGKMGVPDGILLKPDTLTENEWTMMRQHPQFAYEMLAPINYLRKSIDIPYCHHEKWDGTGYPRGLKGEQIPLAARIFALIDVWDAVTSDRPYRKGWTKDQALAYIREQSGKHFDPHVVEAFLREIGRI